MSKAVMQGRMIGANFEEDTLTFEMDKGYYAAAGKYVIVRESEYESAAEQSAALLERLEVLTAACEAEFCGEGTEEMEPDDSKVSFPEDRCHITFGMIRQARAAIALAQGDAA